LGLLGEKIIIEEVRRIRDPIYDVDPYEEEKKAKQEKAKRGRGKRSTKKELFNKKTLVSKKEEFSSIGRRMLVKKDSDGAFVKRDPETLKRSVTVT